MSIKDRIKMFESSQQDLQPKHAVAPKAIGKIGKSSFAPPLNSKPVAKPSIGESVASDEARSVLPNEPKSATTEEQHDEREPSSAPSVDRNSPTKDGSVSTRRESGTDQCTSLDGTAKDTADTSGKELADSKSTEQIMDKTEEEQSGSASDSGKQSTVAPGTAAENTESHETPKQVRGRSSTGGAGVSALAAQLKGGIMLPGMTPPSIGRQIEPESCPEPSQPPMDEQQPLTHMTKRRAAMPKRRAPSSIGK